MGERLLSPVQSALRFLLEIAALYGWGALAFARAPDGWGWPAAIVAGLTVATIWAVFNVPGDPSRSGRAPVPVRGAVRLALEMAVLLGAAAAIWAVDRPVGAAQMLLLTLFHYAMTTDRLRWLLAR